MIIKADVISKHYYLSMMQLILNFTNPTTNKNETH